MLNDAMLTHRVKNNVFIHTDLMLIQTLKQEEKANEHLQSDLGRVL